MARKSSARRAPRPLLLGGLLLAVAAAGAAGFLWFGEGGAEEIRLRPDDAALVAEGEAIYAAQCASCHGADLEGQANWRERKADGRLPAPPHDASGHTWHHPDGQLFALTKQGPAALVGGDYQSDMPGYAGVLSDREIVAVLSYIKSRWPAEIRARHDALNER